MTLNDFQPRDVRGPIFLADLPTCICSDRLTFDQIRHRNTRVFFSGGQVCPHHKGGAAAPQIVGTFYVCPTGPDLRGPKGPGPQASHQQRASHQTRHILFVVHDSCLYKTD